MNKHIHWKTRCHPPHGGFNILLHPQRCLGVSSRDILLLPDTAHGLLHWIRVPQLEKLESLNKDIAISTHQGLASVETSQGKNRSLPLQPLSCRDMGVHCYVCSQYAVEGSVCVFFNGFQPAWSCKWP